MQDLGFGLLRNWLVGSVIWVVYANQSGWDREALPLFAYMPPLGFLIALVLISWTSKPIMAMFKRAGRRRMR
jgi:hypothetical protein